MLLLAKMYTREKYFTVNKSINRFGVIRNLNIMKAFVFLIGMSAVFTKELYAQCSKPGLKIQSEACNAPKDLEVKSFSCSEIKVSWTGNKEQTYIVKANSNDQVSGNVIELKTSQPICDDNGNCTATIKVNEGSDVSWSVQSFCTIKQANLYSAEINGTNADIPFCKKIIDSVKTVFLVYPNPAPGYLIVDYLNVGNGSNIQLQIFDVAGKMVFKRAETLLSGINRYNLDLHNLPSGTYTIELFNGKLLHQNKFVLVRKQ